MSSKSATSWGWRVRRAFKITPAIETVKTEPGLFSRELRRLLIPVWSCLRCYPARFMASPRVCTAAPRCCLLFGAIGDLPPMPTPVTPPAFSFADSGPLCRARNLFQSANRRRDQCRADAEHHDRERRHPPEFEQQEANQGYCDIAAIADGAKPDRVVQCRSENADDGGVDPSQGR